MLSVDEKKSLASHGVLLYTLFHAMKSDLVAHYRQSFESIVQQHQGTECWSARDLQPLLGYDEWRNFLQVIERAMESCKNSKKEPKYHFVGVNKLIETGKGAERQVEDYLLTRYACYLVAQNGDLPS